MKWLLVALSVLVSGCSGSQDPADASVDGPPVADAAIDGTTIDAAPNAFTRSTIRVTAAGQPAVGSVYQLRIAVGQPIIGVSDDSTNRIDWGLLPGSNAP